MRRQKFTLYRYVKLTTGKWQYARCVQGKNGKPIPDHVIIGGQDTIYAGEGAYYFNVAGNWIRAGDTVAEAADERTRRLRQKRENGIDLEENPSESTPKGTSLAAAVERYFLNLEAQGKDPKTLRTYRLAVEPFVANCKKAKVKDIGKQDMMDYMAWLRRQPVAQRKHGNPERTYANKVGHVAIFLTAIGKPRLLTKNEYPQYEEKTVPAHTDQELEYLYTHADAEQRFLLDFALGSGFRDGEIAHSEYTDLVGTVLEVKRKPHLNWHPKKHHCRNVPVPQSLADAIRSRGVSGLIFPNQEGKPNQHLLRDVQALVKGVAFHSLYDHYTDEAKLSEDPLIHRRRRRSPMTGLVPKQGAKRQVPGSVVVCETEERVDGILNADRRLVGHKASLLHRDGAHSAENPLLILNQSLPDIP